MSIDFFNPNIWAHAEPFEFRIYGDDNAQTWAAVDEDDYHFLVQWKWSWDDPGMRRGIARRKPRLRRNVQTTIAPSYAKGHYIDPETGRELRHRSHRVQQKLFLHVVVMLRTGITPETPEHELVDHLDGDERNCRRVNLRWATHTINSNNRFGSAVGEMF